MNKKLLILLLALVVAVGLVVAACGDDEETTTTAAPGATETTAAPDATETTAAPESTETTAAEPMETITLTFSDHNPPGNAAAEALTAYANYIAENSNGQVEVDIQLGGALYGNMEIFDGVRTGGADAGHYVIESGDGFYYALATALPFWNFADNAAAVDAYWTLYDEYPEIEEEFSAVGLHYGTHFAMPPIHIHWHDAGVDLTSPDQLQGKTLLTLESFVAEWFSLLGASMENPAFPDLFSMIDTRAADGYVQHGPFLGGFDLVDDFQSHTIFGDGGILQLSIGIIWNKETWDSLPADIQQVALDAREVYLETFNAGSTADDEAFWAAAEEANHTVVELTPEQIEPWKQGLASVYTDWVEGAPDPGAAQAMYDKLVELTGQ